MATLKVDFQDARERKSQTVDKSMRRHGIIDKNPNWSNIGPL
jgi:hypothetical protein